MFSCPPLASTIPNGHYLGLGMTAKYISYAVYPAYLLD